MRENYIVKIRENYVVKIRENIKNSFDMVTVFTWEVTLVKPQTLKYIGKFMRDKIFHRFIKNSCSWSKNVCGWQYVRCVDTLAHW